MTAGTRKILVIEDEAFLRSTLVKRLELEGYEVHEAVNGELGLEYALEDHPVLILLDLLMPGGGGIEMLKKLRKDTWGSEASIMVLTNVTGAKEVSEAVELGVKDFLVKVDMKLDEVIQRIKEKMASIN